MRSRSGSPAPTAPPATASSAALPTLGPGPTAPLTCLPSSTTTAASHAPGYHWVDRGRRAASLSMTIATRTDPGDARADADGEHFMQIGEVSQRTGLTQRALRY